VTPAEAPGQPPGELHFSGEAHRLPPARNQRKARRSRPTAEAQKAAVRIRPTGLVNTVGIGWLSSWRRVGGHWTK